MKKILVFSLLLLVVQACTKEKVTEPAKNDNPVSLESILMQKRWQLVAWKSSPAFFGDTDLYVTSPPCEKDNYYEFKKDSIFNFHYNTLKCDPSEKDYIQNKWFVKGDSISMWGTSYYIVSFDNNTLKTKGSQKFGPTVYVYNYTYKSME